MSSYSYSWQDHGDRQPRTTWPLCGDLVVTTQVPRMGQASAHALPQRSVLVGGCCTHEPLLPAQICNHSSSLLCFPLHHTRRLNALGRKKIAVIYFPARISLTTLLVFAAGTDLGAGEGLHIQILTCNCVSPMPSTGSSRVLEWP